MALTRGEMNTLYRDSIIQVLSTKIDNYRKTDILQPSDDMVLEQDTGHHGRRHQCDCPET